MISHGAVQAVKEYRIRGICGQQKRSAYPPDSLDRNPNKPLAMQVDPKPALSPR